MASFSITEWRKQRSKPKEKLYALITEEEYAQLLKWHATVNEYNRDSNFIKKFEAIVEKYPSQEALSLRDQVLTYKELNERANQLAFHILKKLHPIQPKIIGVCLEPSFELLIGILAILKTGAAYLPMDSSYPTERLLFMLKDAKVDGLITHSNFQTIFSDAHHPIINIEKEAEQIHSQPKKNLSTHISNKDLAYIIYTSGSTGKPKGVLLSHQNLNHFCHWFKDATQVTNRDIFDFSSSISFDFTIPMTLFPLIHGAKIAICEEQNKKDPLLYIEHLTTQKITITKLTPSYFRQLKEFIEPDHKLPDLRLIIFGGETLFKSDIEAWLKQFPHHLIMNEYGPTEAAVATTWLLINNETINQFNHIIPIGKAVANAQIHLLNDALQYQPIGEIGEIYIAGDGVAEGYLNRKEITQKKFILNPFAKKPQQKMYKTGDLGCYLENGDIEFHGRVDHQVKIRGFRVELEEINNCLANHSDIQQSAVLIKEFDNGTDKKIIAYCIPKEKNTLDSAELKTYILNYLPDYMLPDFFIFTDHFPLNANGKVDLKALADIQPEKDLLVYESLNTQEKQLQKIWLDILHIPTLKPNDNFFEVGGNSLLAAKAMNRIRKLTGKDLHLNELYEAPTIRKLAALISIKNNIVETEVQGKSLKKLTKIPLTEMQFLFWLMQNFTTYLRIPNIVTRQRVKGRLNPEKLLHAFKKVILKHEILTYHIPTFFPWQFIKKALKFDLIENDLSKMSADEQRAYLINSLTQLKNKSVWKKTQPLITVKLYYLTDEISEIQIALPHIISDDISANAILSDLSWFYTHSAQPVDQVPQFKEYVVLEQNSMHTLKRDALFWEQYLEDISFLQFPPNLQLSQKNFSHTYSVFLLPEEIGDKLNQLSIKLHLTNADILCAVVSLALTKYLGPDTTKKIAINFVKSTRDNENYEKSVGLFLRTDLIKVDLSSSEVNLINLSQQIEHNKNIAIAYQSCPQIIKLAGALKKYWSSKNISKPIVNVLSYLLGKILKPAGVSETVLACYGKVLIAKQLDFFVNINILHRFIAPGRTSTQAFGFPLLPIERAQNENVAAQNVLDICFDRNEENQPCLLVRGNLKPEVRQRIGQDILQVIHSQLWPVSPPLEK